jgi:hypothetical protein
MHLNEGVCGTARHINSDGGRVRVAGVLTRLRAAPHTRQAVFCIMNNAVLLNPVYGNKYEGPVDMDNKAGVMHQVAAHKWLRRKRV